MKKTNKIILLLIISLSLFSSGCWDKLEINDRSFVTAISIDKNKEVTSEDKAKGQNKYTIGFSIANLKSFVSGEGEAAMLLTASGSSLMDVITHLMNTTSRYVYLDHVKIVVVSDDIAKDPDYLKEILDGLERNPSISRRMNILISQDSKAKEVIEVRPETAEQVGFYIQTLLNATNRPARFNPETLGEFLQQLHTYDSALIPTVTVSDEDILLNGSAVLKDYKIIGYLDGISTRSIMFINNEVRLEEVNVLYEDILIPYNVSSSKAKKILVKKDDEIQINIDLEVEGFISQYKLETKDNLFKNKKLESIEKEIEKTIEKQIKDVISIMQNEYSLDLIGIGDYLSKYHPSLWKELEKNWNTEFSNIDIQLNVDAKIRRIGMIK